MWAALPRLSWAKKVYCLRHIDCQGLRQENAHHLPGGLRSERPTRMVLVQSSAAQSTHLDTGINCSTSSRRKNCWARGTSGSAEQSWSCYSTSHRIHATTICSSVNQPTRVRSKLSTAHVTAATHLLRSLKNLHNPVITCKKGQFTTNGY